MVTNKAMCKQDIEFKNETISERKRNGRYVLFYLVISVLLLFKFRTQTIFLLLFKFRTQTSEGGRGKKSLKGTDMPRASSLQLAQHNACGTGLPPIFCSAPAQNDSSMLRPRASIALLLPLCTIFRMHSLML